MTDDDADAVLPAPTRPMAGFDGPTSTEVSLSDADLSDALSELRSAEKKSKRHLLWAVAGLSPAAVIPLVGLLAEGSFGLVVTLLVLVVLIEGWRFAVAEKEARRLRRVVERIEGRHPDSPTEV